MVKRRILIRIGMLLAVLALIVVLPAHLVVGQTGNTQSITVTVTAVPGYIYTPPGGGSGDRGFSHTTPPQESVVNTEGVFTQPVILYSDDSTLVISFNEGTKGIMGDGSPLKEVYIQEEGAIYFMEMDDEIYIREMKSPPLPPEDTHIIGLVFEVGPSGATFNPAITMEFTYDPDDIPEGVTEEDLVIAFYDEDATDKGRSKATPLLLLPP